MNTRYRRRRKGGVEFCDSSLIGIIHPFQNAPMISFGAHLDHVYRKVGIAMVKMIAQMRVMRRAAASQQGSKGSTVLGSQGNLTEVL